MIIINSSKLAASLTSPIMREKMIITTQLKNFKLLNYKSIFSNINLTGPITNLPSNQHLFIQKKLNN